MKIKMLPSSVSQECRQFSSSFVINEQVAIDAGSLGFSLLADQKRIQHVFLSHAHLDHIGSLPVFLDNVYTPGPDCPIVYGSQHVIDCLQRYFFNDQVWPDAIRLSREESPFVRFVALDDRKTVVVGGLSITPVTLNHVVPCFGFLIDEGSTTVAMISDTGPTEEIWTAARRSPHLKAVFLEAAFPNSHAWLATKSLHLTSAQFLAEYRKLGRDVTVVAIHIKCGFYDFVVAELKQLGILNLLIGEPNGVYEF